MTQRLNDPPEGDSKTLSVTLANDHARLTRLFGDVFAAFEADARLESSALWTRFEQEIEAHFQLEEQHLFPRLARVKPGDAAALRIEHDAIRARIAELGVGLDLHLTRADLVEALMVDLQEHIERETTLLYPWVDETLPVAEQAWLVTQLLRTWPALLRLGT